MDAQAAAKSLGGKWHGGYGTAPCPTCQPERRLDQHGLSLRDDGDRLLAYCHKSGCTFSDIMRVVGLSRDIISLDTSAQRELNAKHFAYRLEQRAKARKIWQRGLSINGTWAETYLRARGITVPVPDRLRFLPNAYHSPSARWLCAMVADVQPTGGIHRTFFTTQGERLEKSAKLMLGPCSGGAVRLSDGDGPLVVCEGIETGLSLLSGLLRGPATVWAALSTSGIKALQLPPHPAKLIIATDGDEPGQSAGNVLADRAHAFGWDVSLLPAPEHRDWNDVLQSGGCAA